MSINSRYLFLMMQELHKPIDILGCLHFRGDGWMSQRSNFLDTIRLAAWVVVKG
jgi:hypothetical protein